MAHILVIDDQDVLLALISHALQLSGHIITAFSDPFLALDYLKTVEQPIDLLLTDIDMPRMTGLELVIQFNRAGFWNPVLFMSGYPPLAVAVAESFGMSAVLEKPFTVSQLREAVSAAVALKSSSVGS
jgi:two-component system cell cycle sensor histidine kinase/response regulator CckA